MADIIIYHNNRCKKSRAGLAYLSEKTNDFKIINYIKDGLQAEELRLIAKKLGVRPADMIRTQEAFYKSHIKGKEFTDEEYIQFIVEKPKLLKRPVILVDDKAVWADPPEKLDEIWK